MRASIGSVLAQATMVCEDGHNDNINKEEHHAVDKSDCEIRKNGDEELSVLKSPEVGGDNQTLERSHTCTGGDDISEDAEELDLDDYVRDPDYFPEKRDKSYESSDELEKFPTYINEASVDHEEVVQDQPTVKRRKRRSEHEWNRQKQMVARMAGRSYKGWKKNEEGKWLLTEARKERVLKPPGCSKQCRNSKIKCCDQISENLYSISSGRSMIGMRRNCMSLPQF